jgi:alkylhydroperoxidase family enzyme
MKDPYEGARKTLEDAVLRGPGQSDAKAREAVADREAGDIPPELAQLVEKMERDPSKVTDEDIATLKATYSEDQIFELVVSAALGASRRRLAAGLRALEEA